MVAFEATARLAVIWVLLATVTPDAVTPEAPILRVAGETKFIPVSVTGVLVLSDAELGLIDVRVGMGCATVKVIEPLVTLFIVTLTLWPPSAAPVATLKVAVICVPLTTDTLEAVTPEPEMLRITGETKFVPVSVTGTLTPGAPEEGLTDVKVGAEDMTVNVRDRLVTEAVVTLTL